MSTERGDDTAGTGPIEHGEQEAVQTVRVSPPASPAGHWTKRSDDEHRKLELDTARQVRPDDGGDRVTAIIQVAEAGYVPAGVKVRARLGPQMFTAEVAAGDLEHLQNDAQVVSIGTAKRIHPVAGE